MKRLTQYLTQFKQWILCVVMPCYSSQGQSKKSKKIKSLFLIYFDGSYGIEPSENVSDTYTMGVCKLDYNDKKNILTVHLRRPGLLIGKSGTIIEKAEKWLKCKIEIIEVNLLK